MYIQWSGVLVPVEVMFRIKPMLTRGPASFSGKRQIGAADAGYWVATLTGFPIVTPEQILEWRGLIADLQGGLEDLVISAFDTFQAPVVGDLPPVITGIPHSDGSFFSDGSGYSQSTIHVKLEADAALRATTARLLIEEAGPLKRGMYFSRRETTPVGIRPRMYMITKPPEIDGNIANITFLPPLRSDAVAGEDLDFADPKATMNLASPDVGALPLEMGRWSRPTLELEESWYGL